MLLLLLPIMTGCRTTKQKQNKPVLPPKPERQELTPPETLKDYALLIVYYDSLVQEWESWGEAVEGIVDGISYDTK